MKVGLIGFHGAGKSTLYRAAARGMAKGDITAVPVPDERFDRIVAQVKPKKVTPATVILHDDIDDLQPTGRMVSVKANDALRKAEVILHVVRGFDAPISPYYDTIDPLRDDNKVYEELVLTDLQMVETRLEKLIKSQNSRSAGHPEYSERQMMERIQPILEEGQPLRLHDFAEEEAVFLRNYQFLTYKPLVVAFNVGESEAANPGEKINQRIEERKKLGIPAFAICATLEEEISQLDAADQPDFLESLGLSEPASNKVIRAVYDAMGLITFFTAGESETRAWPLAAGSTALKAAGTIHTDIAKGFIRSETVSYADYVEHGSLDAAYASGKMRLEGKEYVVKDGDLLHIRNKS